jgi:hypothetical protein
MQSAYNLAESLTLPCDLTIERHIGNNVLKGRKTPDLLACYTQGPGKEAPFDLAALA